MTTSLLTAASYKIVAGESSQNPENILGVVKATDEKKNT